eukprot:1137397-Pelagomonas_calceolata.AAC.1
MESSAYTITWMLISLSSTVTNTNTGLRRPSLKLAYQKTSNSFWNNPKITLKQIRLLNYRTDTIYTQKHAFRFNHTSGSAHCRLCSNMESINHVVLGCSHPTRQGMFINRHNTVVIMGVTGGEALKSRRRRATPAGAWLTTHQTLISYPLLAPSLAGPVSLLDEALASLLVREPSVGANGRLFFLNAHCRTASVSCKDNFSISLATGPPEKTQRTDLLGAYGTLICAIFFVTKTGHTVELLSRIVQMLYTVEKTEAKSERFKFKMKPSKS